MENDIIKIQEIISHQGDEISRLSAELYAQQKEINKLGEQLKKLQARFKVATGDEEGIRPTDQEVPPPHY